MIEAERSWSQYWQSEGAGGEVFVNNQGGKHDGLRKFWRDHLDCLGKGTRLIDLACGAGSILADLSNKDNYELFAADYSQSALEQLSNRMPNVKTRVCSADNLPYQKAFFDRVVSQFGIEYAGPKAFEEAARILKPGGKLIVLCHIRDGYIDSKNKMELIGAERVSELGFIDACIGITKAYYSGDETDIHKKMDIFTQVEPEIAKLLEYSQSGVHVYLYEGFKQLFMKRDAYEESDITNWLIEMKAEVDKSILRLSEMRKAAFSQEQLLVISRNLASIYEAQSEFTIFKLDGHKLPVAWHFEFQKR